ncbi:hypothetical protein L9F63_024505, partial [Diploptera punctata]
ESKGSVIHSQICSFQFVVKDTGFVNRANVFNMINELLMRSERDFLRLGTSLQLGSYNVLIGHHRYVILIDDTVSCLLDREREKCGNGT